MIKAANDVLAFLLEIAALAAVVLWGFTIGSSLPTRLVLGVGAPAVLIAVWGMWLAPASEQRLSMPWLLIAKLVVFGLATVALIAVGRLRLGPCSRYSWCSISDSPCSGSVLTQAPSVKIKVRS